MLVAWARKSSDPRLQVARHVKEKPPAGDKSAGGLVEVLMVG